MQKGTAPLFIIIVVLLLIGLVGIFAFGFIKSPLPKQMPLKFPSSSPAPLTYTNQNLDFEFQYSGNGLAIKEDTEEAYNKRGNGDFRKNFKGYVGYEPGIFLGATLVLDATNSFDNSPFTVWVFDNQEDWTIDKWFSNYWYYPYLWGVFDYTSKGHIALDTEATVSGIPAKYKIVSYQPGKPKFVYVSNRKKMYLFRIIDNESKAGDKILSTFKFL